MRANGPVESFTRVEIGRRDGWVCGFCHDPERLVNNQPGAPRALRPSIDHVMPVSAGGTHTRDNVQISHRWCNSEKNCGESPSPEVMRAKLSRVLEGTPVPEATHRSQYPTWTWPSSPRIEFVIALYIAGGRVAADPRYGDPATRLADAAARQFGEAEAGISRGLDWISEANERRSHIDAWWRSSP
jgi:hypothetical protein